METYNINLSIKGNESKLIFVGKVDYRHWIIYDGRFHLLVRSLLTGNYPYNLCRGCWVNLNYKHEVRICNCLECVNGGEIFVPTKFIPGLLTSRYMRRMMKKVIRNSGTYETKYWMGEQFITQLGKSC